MRVIAADKGAEGDDNAARDRTARPLQPLLMSPDNQCNDRAGYHAPVSLLCPTQQLLSLFFFYNIRFSCAPRCPLPVNETRSRVPDGVSGSFLSCCQRDSSNNVRYKQFQNSLNFLSSELPFFIHLLIFLIFAKEWGRFILFCCIYIFTHSFCKRNRLFRAFLSSF